ncbi:MAG: DUF4115 domain-containing protein [Comamonas sp.]|nr:DUF4115 domain-containing protein [Comamonas sp.]
MTAGRLLAARREDAGLHLAALAATLKVPLHKLQALEDDRYDTFDDIVFLRALASSVCRVLKMDAGPVLALLPQSAPVALKDQQGLNARFKDAGGRSDGGGAMGLPMSRLTAFAVIALLAAALVIAFVPRSDNAAFVPPQTETETTPAQVPEPVPAPTREAVTPMAPLAATAPAPGNSPPAAGMPLPDTAAAIKPEEPSAEPGLAAPTATAADALVIQAREQTWVQVRDPKGMVLAERTLHKGERYALQGSGPWSVVIGRADAADVTVRGQPMDLSAIARSNVARFEVK